MEQIINIDNKSNKTEIIELEEAKEIIDVRTQAKIDKVLNRRKSMMDKWEEYYKNL